MNDDLIKGGQGREPDDVEDSGRVCGWLLLAAIGLALIVGLAGCECGARCAPESALKRMKN